MLESLGIYSSLQLRCEIEEEGREGVSWVVDILEESGEGAFGEEIHAVTGSEGRFCGDTEEREPKALPPIKFDRLAWLKGGRESRRE